MDRQAPPVPFPGLRRRLSAGPVGLDANPHVHWFARADDDLDGEPRLGLAVPRAVGSAVVRNRLKRQLREIWAELAGDVPRGRDYVLVARAGPRGAGRDARPRVAHRAGSRGDRQSEHLMSRIGIAAVHLWRHTLGLLTPAGTCKYHPSCSQYALDALRELRARSEAPSSPAGACSAAIRGATAGSTTRTTRRSSGAVTGSTTHEQPAARRHHRHPPADRERPLGSAHVVPRLASGFPGPGRSSRS